MRANTLLRRALEEDNNKNLGVTIAEPDKTAPIATPEMIVMTGPLSEVFTKALQEVYEKDITDQLPGAVMESQAIDVAIAQKLSKNITTNGDVAPTDNYQKVYGVSKGELTQDAVIDITREIQETPETNEFVLIIDHTVAGASDGTGSAETHEVESVSTLAAVTESFVEAIGGRVFHSLAEYTKAFK